MDPQSTLLNLDYDENNAQKYYSNVEPWDGNYDSCLMRTTQPEWNRPSKQLRQFKVTLPQSRYQSRRRSVESVTTNESCQKMEQKTLSCFQMTSTSPRKNSTHQYKQNCLKLIFSKQQGLSWSDYYKQVCKNHNQRISPYNLVGYNVQYLQTTDKDAIFQKFKLRLKQSVKNKTQY